MHSNIGHDAIVRSIIVQDAIVHSIIVHHAIGRSIIVQDAIVHNIIVHHAIGRSIIVHSPTVHSIIVQDAIAHSVALHDAICRSQLLMTLYCSESSLAIPIIHPIVMIFEHSDKQKDWNYTEKKDLIDSIKWEYWIFFNWIN